MTTGARSSYGKYLASCRGPSRPTPVQPIPTLVEGAAPMMYRVAITLDGDNARTYAIEAESVEEAEMYGRQHLLALLDVEVMDVRDEDDYDDYLVAS